MKKKEHLWVADQRDGTYQNPILYTDYSDPDVIRHEDDYYMVASSFSNVPALPVLHSKDLVNWKVVSYVMDKIPFPNYDEPAHGRGVWAPSIRFQEGLFYIYFPMPDEGIFVSTSENPKQGKWSEPVCVKEGKGYIDPCPFWDTSGKAYLIYAYAKSRIGIKSILHISPMSWDGKSLLGDGMDVFDGHNTQPTIEGPKLYKKNNFYYIFAPAGSVKSGWQTALRSKNIYGPYEEKIVMMQGDTEINGPHQGGWVDTQSGEDWFIHFQDVGNAGRIVHLQPMIWENDWPVIGKNSGEGYGEPVSLWKKPDVGREYPICVPEDSDDFEESKLGHQWQWNANYNENWYSLENSGLVLYSQPGRRQLCDVPNLLLQKWTAPSFSQVSKVHIENLKEGDIAGIISLGTRYTALAIERKNNQNQLIQIIGVREKGEKKQVIGIWNEVDLYIKMEVDMKGNISWNVKSQEHFQRVGEIVSMTPGRWVGVKSGLFIINCSETNGGSVKFDFFMFENIMGAL